MSSLSMMDLCFDILEDLSDELEVGDYFEFLGVNDLVGELWFNMMRRYEFYLATSRGLFLEYVGSIGDLEFIEWLYMTDRGDPIEDILTGACGGGHLKVVKWVHSIGNRGSVRAFDYACERGHYEIIKWMHDKRFVRHDKVSSKAMDSACKNGHFDIVRWLHYDKRDCSGHPLDNACMNGNLEISKWLHENGYEIKTYRTIRIACSNGHLEMIKWLHSARITYKKDAWAHHEMFECSCERGDMAMARWIYENFRITDVSDAISNACSGGHLEMVKWLFEIASEDAIDDSCAFNVASSNGHLEVVKWLHENSRCEGHEIMGASSHLSIIEWLLANCPKVDDKILGSAIHNACVMNHLDVAKLLHARLVGNFSGSETIDIVCSRGRLEIAKWLYEIGCRCSDTEINYVCAGTYGYVDVVRWIVETGQYCDLMGARLCALNNRKQEIVDYLDGIIVKIDENET